MPVLLQLHMQQQLMCSPTVIQLVLCMVDTGHPRLVQALLPLLLTQGIMELLPHTGLRQHLLAVLVVVAATLSILAPINNRMPTSKVRVPMLEQADISRAVDIQLLVRGLKATRGLLDPTKGDMAID
mgnify:CR=1 FL=1